MEWLERLVERRRRTRKRKEGRWDWWDDEWRVERALREGIRYSDDELLAQLNGPRMPLWSYNEAKRATELHLQTCANDVDTTSHGT